MSLIWSPDLYSKYTTPVKHRYSAIPALSNARESGKEKGTKVLFLNTRNLKLNVVHSKVNILNTTELHTKKW